MFDKKDMAAPSIVYQELKLMEGCPPPCEKLIVQHSWDSPPYNHWSYQHMSKLFPACYCSDL